MGTLVSPSQSYTAFAQDRPTPALVVDAQSVDFAADF
jgi:hypothetical protein